MATTTGTFNFYHHVSERAGDGGIDFDNDSFEALLTTSLHTPADSDTAIADIDNEVSGNGFLVPVGHRPGYARQTLTSVTWNRASGVTTFDSADPVFTASGGSIVARNWHVRDTTGDLLIAYGLLDNTPADVTTTDGNTLTIQVNASGWFTSDSS